MNDIPQADLITITQSLGISFDKISGNYYDAAGNIIDKDALANMLMMAFLDDFGVINSIANLSVSPKIVDVTKNDFRRKRCL